ncbi:MAG TPA: response regulator [Saprospiraceae bacterium]|nr:response regulator [Saprospiraceae bacterium]
MIELEDYLIEPSFYQSKIQNPKEINILVVEDNPEMLDYLLLLLSDYSVVTAINGKIALDYLNSNTSKEERVDLIISDLMMPEMDGFELLENIKSDDRWRHLPVIMLTANMNVVARLKALRIGVDDFLTKPFIEEELQARIENLIHNYKERMALFSKTLIEEGKDSDTKRPIIAQVDSEWLKEVEALFSKNLSDRNFKLDWLASQLFLSQRQLDRRLKQLTGLTPNQYMQEMRLQLAKEYLLIGKYATIKETGYSVGFRDTAYFSTIFQARFGLQPSAYL